MALPLKSITYSIYFVVFIAMGVLISMGIRQYQLYHVHESVISQTERLIFQYSIIREHVSDALLGGEESQLSGISSEMEKLNNNLSDILADTNINDEYKLSFLNSIDLPGIILLLRKIEGGSNNLENIRTVNRDMRTLGERLILFDRVLVGNAKQKLIAFQNIIIGSAGLIVFLLVTVLALFHRKLIIPILQLIKQSAETITGKTKPVQENYPSHEVNRLATTMNTLIRQEDELRIQMQRLSEDLSSEHEKSTQLEQELSVEKNKKAEMVRVSHLAVLGEVTTGIAHEVNNFSNGIINYAQVLADGACDPDFEEERDKLFHKIIIEGEKIAGLSKNILAFGQDDAESRELAQVDDILENSMALMNHFFRIDGTIIDTDLETIPSCKSNGRQMQQVFLNILNNARRALNERFPQKDPNKILKISAKEIEKNGTKMLRISFTDHGIGIPGENMDHLFNPSFSTKKPAEGAGMGLTVCKELIDLHHGIISLESQVNDHTTVTIELPLV